MISTPYFHILVKEGHLNLDTKTPFVFFQDGQMATSSLFLFGPYAHRRSSLVSLSHSTALQCIIFRPSRLEFAYHRTQQAI